MCVVVDFDIYLLTLFIIYEATWTDLFASELSMRGDLKFDEEDALN
jgi:hypothetical protein